MQSTGYYMEEERLHPAAIGKSIPHTPPSEVVRKRLVVTNVVMHHEGGRVQVKRQALHPNLLVDVPKVISIQYSSKQNNLLNFLETSQTIVTYHATRKNTWIHRVEKHHSHIATIHFQETLFVYLLQISSMVIQNVHPE